MTPLYLGLLSNYFGLSIHPKTTKEEEIYIIGPVFLAPIYSILREFLMFPYIILFFPFMIILLLPGILSYKYYLYIYNTYVTTLFAGPYSLKNVVDN